MSLNLECTVCKEADLSEVACGALECGHIYCADCIYKLWHTETAAASERREARTYRAMLPALTRGQIQALAEEEAADNGRKLRCPSCQRCSSVDAVRRVFLSSSQTPSTAPVTSPPVSTRSNSSASAEEVEDLSAQLAVALEHLDAAHVQAADSARAHDLHMQQMQTQLMAHAEQAHQSQVQGLAETNAQLQRELTKAQAQLNQAAREAKKIKEQYDRAVRELSEAREQKRITKARASEATVKARDAAMDRLADRLDANGTIGAPLGGGTQTVEGKRQTRSTSSLTSNSTSTGNRTMINSTQRDTTKAARADIQTTPAASEISYRSTRSRNSVPVPVPVSVTPQSGNVSSGTRSRRSEPGAAKPARSHTPSKSEIEEKAKLANRANDPPGKPSNTIRKEDSPKIQTRGTSSATTKLQPGKKDGAAAALLPSSDDRESTVVPAVDHRDPEVQRFLREKALAAGKRWPLSDKIIVPPCSGPKAEHDFKGKGSNQTYLKHCCEVCHWGCEERTPDGYIPESRRRTTKRK